ncbi:MAG TPA: hypothetical protein VFZ53_21120 [Polyangiaceae bacterium]
MPGPERRPDDAGACRTGAHGAACTLLGALLSGPVAMLAVQTTHPQPPWQGPEVFVRNHHPVQALPFFLGFFLVSGFVVLIASLHALAREEHRALTGAALALAAAFAALVFLNYTIQTTFVPALVSDYTAGNDPLLSALTLSNPKSLGWALEMWGYALLGMATWLVSPVFRESRLERAAAWAFIANGPASIVAAVWTAFEPGWELTGPGLISFALWNLLVVAMAVLAFRAFRRRLDGAESANRLLR